MNLQEQDPQSVSHYRKFVGVHFRPEMKTRRWCAQISINGKLRKLGYFATPEEASAVYQKAVEERDRLPDELIAAMRLVEKTEPDTKCIPLTLGQFTRVDATDYEWLSQWKWYAHYDPRMKKYYAVRGFPKRYFMHREIMKFEDGVLVDHKSMATLDNRRENLRPATYAQNAQNRKKYASCKSGYKGVYKASNGSWRAQITVNKKKHDLGCFPTPEEAHAARVKAVHELHGEFANY